MESLACCAKEADTDRTRTVSAHQNVHELHIIVYSTDVYCDSHYCQRQLPRDNESTQPHGNVNMRRQRRVSGVAFGRPRRLPSPKAFVRNGRLRVGARHEIRFRVGRLVLESTDFTRHGWREHARECARFWGPRVLRRVSPRYHSLSGRLDADTASEVTGNS